VLTWCLPKERHKNTVSIEHVPAQPLATSTDIDSTVEPSIDLVNELIAESEKIRSRHDEANRRRFSRLLKDSAAIDLTMSLTDEVMRITSMRRAAKTFRRSAKSVGRQGLGSLDYSGIKLAAPFSLLFPHLVMRIVHKRVRMAAEGIILPAESALLQKHIANRAKEGIQLNINLLGEAVLGENEASQRLAAIMELVTRPHINYVSVKISSIVSQLITVDHAGSVERAAERLRLLYAQAIAHNVFVNLDMEEFRDLAITVDVFKKVLSEPEFENLEAGIVLQAYLPDSHSAFSDLVQWSISRHKKTGARIKIRLVKGANLAMEKAEAELHGWVPAPYASKADVDASYTRLIDCALRAENSAAVRIGIASHNLFHLSWAIEVARLRGVENQLDIEMLEGMANAESLAISHRAPRVLLYTPVTQYENFPTAVAYLVRRLDENTSTDNYLRASFDIAQDKTSFSEQRERFLASVRDRHTISTKSRRHNLHRENAEQEYAHGIFINASDSDATNPLFIQKLQSNLESIYSDNTLTIPLVIAGNEVQVDDFDNGLTPNEQGSQWYRYSIATPDLVDKAFDAARLALTNWSALGAHGRGEILAKAAHLMESDRAIIIATMSRDAGKTYSEADPEVSEGVDFARFYALSSREKEQGSTPVGVVVIVPPWNFPFAIPLGGVCAALAAGNAVILKSAPETVATSWLMAQFLWSAGVPKDVLQFVSTRDDEVGKYLVSNGHVDALVLTGAFETANLFTSWRGDLNLLAETSGKNAILISASADIDNAVKDLVQSAFGHAGQKCSAASLAIVETGVYRNPAFIHQLKDAVQTLTTASSQLTSTAVGPLIHPPTGALLRALTTLDEGESWLVAPQALDAAGYLWSPGVKIGVHPGSWSHKNEWFGPVLGVIEAPDFETAIEIQNASDFGLTAGIHSLDVVECEQWINRIQAGNLYVNRGTTGAVVNRQPFGGWKRSSVGATSKAGGSNYLNNLRSWEAMKDISLTQSSSRDWWQSIGSLAIDHSGLRVERNYQRYRPYLKPIVVCIDSTVDEIVIAYIEWISQLVGTKVEFNSSNSPIGDCSKVRWLRDEPAPIAELLMRGISVDRRPIAARGDVETPRWLLEQSVSITNHRYGNVGAGPQPEL